MGCKLFKNLYWLMPNICEIVKQMLLSFLKCLLEIVIYFKNNKMSSIRDFVPLSKLG